MLRQIEFIKHPVAPTFPGQNSFVVKPGQKAKYAGIVQDTSFIPYRYGINTAGYMTELGVMMENGSPVTPYGAISDTVIPVNNYNNNIGGVPGLTQMPVFPDFSKLSCVELSQEIVKIREIVGDPSMTEKNAVKELYRSALEQAEKAHKKTCSNSSSSDNPVKDIKDTVIPSDDGSENTVPGDIKTVVPVKVVEQKKNEMTVASNSIPLWAWIAGGALVIIVALK